MAQHRPVDLAQAIVGYTANVCVRDHGDHAWQKSRLAGVDVQYSGVGIRAAQNHAAQLPGSDAVGQKAGVAGEFAGNVGAWVTGCARQWLGERVR